MFDAKDLIESRPGFLYEPRVLWGMGMFTSGQIGGNSIAATVQPQRDSYYNGSRWPIVLTNMITLVVSPAGYVIQGSALQPYVKTEMSALGGARYSFGDVTGLVSPRSSCEATEAISLSPDPMPNIAPASALTPLSSYRSVRNVARWDFDHTLKLPPAAYLEMQVTGRVPTMMDTTTVTPTMDVNFYSAAPLDGANFPGSTITRSRTPVSQLSLATANTYYAQAAVGALTEGGTPIGVDALPFNAAGYVGGSETQLYPSGQTFTSRQAAQQQSTFAAPNNLKGMSVAFDQHALDEAFRTTLGGYPGPLSATTYVRMRSRNGGTQNFWWRDGAPIAICMPSETPGVVSKLDRPLALQPGEGFKITMKDFTGDLPAQWGDLNGNLSMLSVYISFTGYAIIEA